MQPASASTIASLAVSVISFFPAALILRLPNIVCM